MKTMIILSLALALGGCATTTAFDPRGCPQERQYTKAEQDAFLAAMPETPAVIKNALADYRDLRREARACRDAR